jgi:molecular chaperone DnaK
MTQTLSSVPRRESEDPEAVSLRFRFDSETVEQFAERYASDVSRGGIFVHSKQPLPVGTQLKLNLQLLDGTPLIVGEGTVFWTREPDANKPNTVPGMGVRFSKLSSNSQRVIELVLSQRTGRERSGLFPTLNASVIVEETGRHAVANANANPNPAGNANATTSSSSKSKLPFNVFPGRPIGAPGAGDDSRQLLANAGREEATPVVGVNATTLAEARPGKDEPPSKAAVRAKRASEGASGAHDISGASKRNPPALALIKPGTGEHKNADASKPVLVAAVDSGKVSATGRNRAATPTPALTTTQEVGPSLAAATPPAPVQGERALEASQSRAAAPAIDTPAPVAARFSPRNKMIIGAAALLAVTITIFAATRGGSGSGDVKNGARTTVAAVAATAAGAASLAARSSAPGPEAARAVEAAASANLPAAPATEASSSPALEPEGAGSANNRSGSAASASSAASRLADRRAPKGGKPAPGHRPNEVAPAGRSAAPSEKPAGGESPVHVESPGPVAQAAVVRTEPALPPAVHAEQPAAPKSTVLTTPPPVATMAHKLRLTSIPSEADVELDGKVIGRTPLFGVEVDVTRPHTLLVRKDGFAPFKQIISNASEWSLRSAENTATLRIQAFMKKAGQ